MDISSSPLVHFNKLGGVKAATVLIVGGPGIGKHALGKALISIKTQFSLQVRTTTSLPLSKDDSGSRPHIDLIIFIVDLINRHSLMIVEKSLNYVDLAYFVGKVCFVATQVGAYSQRSIDIEKITQLADNYDSPLLTVNMEDDDSKGIVAERLIQLLELSAGFKPNVSPLLIDTTRLPYQTEKL